MGAIIYLVVLQNLFLGNHRWHEEHEEHEDVHENGRLMTRVMGHPRLIQFG